MIENEVDSIKFIFNEFLDDACTSLKQIKTSWMQKVLKTKRKPLGNARY